MKNEVVEKVSYALIREGFAEEQIRTVSNALLMTLSKYAVTKETRELTVYEGDINQNLIQKFLIAKRVAGRTDRTIEYYGKSLISIFREVKKSCLEATADDIRLYLATREMRDGVSKTTLNNELRCLKTFYSYLLAEEFISKNPTLKVESIKQTKKKKEAFTELEVELIRNACRTAREKAIIEMLLSTGCRISELTGIKISEIQDGEVTVHGKGDKYRKVYLNAKAQVAVAQYIEERKDSNPYLFPKSRYSVAGKAGHKLKANKYWYQNPENVADDGAQDKGSIEAIVRKIGCKAGVEKTHPHRFRRTCATFALRRGMPIEQVSKMLGHEQLDTTMVYLDIGERELEAQHRKYIT